MPNLNLPLMAMNTISWVVAISLMPRICTQSSRMRKVWERVLESKTKNLSVIYSRPWIKEPAESSTQLNVPRLIKFSIPRSAAPKNGGRPFSPEISEEVDRVPSIEARLSDEVLARWDRNPSEGGLDFRFGFSFSRNRPIECRRFIRSSFPPSGLSSFLAII